MITNNITFNGKLKRDEGFNENIEKLGSRKKAEINEGLKNVESYVKKAPAEDELVISCSDEGKLKYRLYKNDKLQMISLNIDSKKYNIKEKLLEVAQDLVLSNSNLDHLSKIFSKLFD